MTLGERIKTIIKERRITQVEFAQALGVSANYINLVANGNKPAISETLAKLIEELYGYSAGWVMTGAGEKNTDRELTANKAEILKRVQKMPEQAVQATLAFIIALESINRHYPEDPDNR